MWDIKLQLHDAMYRLRFYSNSLIHILSLSNSHNNVASTQKNRGDKSYRVIVALVYLSDVQIDNNNPETTIKQSLLILGRKTFLLPLISGQTVGAIVRQFKSFFNKNKMPNWALSR